MNFFWPGMPLETDGLVAMETKELLVLGRGARTGEGVEASKVIYFGNSPAWNSHEC